MYIKRRYSFWMTVNWSKWPMIYGALYGIGVALLSYYAPTPIVLPWGPLGVIGIAVAFYLGFKNNSAYDRTWEARKIWGGIVNTSRSFGAATKAFVQGVDADKTQKELIYRHLAWLTALRHQLRLSRPWEHTEYRLKGLYAPTVCEDYNTKLEAELSIYLHPTELKELEGKSNWATQLLKNQSERLQYFRNKGSYDDFRHMELHQLIVECYAEQGRSERIKNFPFPRQYASVATWITWVFCMFVPFGLVDVLKAHETWTLWLVPFLSGVIIWVFFLMEKIGDFSENPFEGTYNDVPISTIARGIEIDLREMIADSDIPKPLGDQNGFQL